MIAVLTGDLVKSSAHGAELLNTARLALADGMGRFDVAFPGVLWRAPNWFRGDGWQVVIKSPQQALCAALHAQAALLSQANVHARVAIGMGTVDQLVPEDPSRNAGEAFERSGRALDKGMSADERIWLSVPERCGELGCLADLARIAGRLAARWSVAQAEAALLALGGRTQREIAAELGIAQSSVHDRLRGGQWDCLAIAIERFRCLSI